MNSAAESIPDNVNVKLILRHSFRPPIVGDKDYRSEELNEYGILKASEFGESIDYPIGGLYSSRIKRCVQTLYFMTGGRKEIEIAPEQLTHVFTYDNKLADEHIRQIGSLKQTIYELKTGVVIPGLYTIEETVRKMLDYIFQTGNKPNTLDIYCTHDFQIAMMIVNLFDNIDTIDSIRTNWPEMLEGLFVYGNRNSFTCIWRGESKQFDHYLMA